MITLRTLDLFGGLPFVLGYKFIVIFPSIPILRLGLPISLAYAFRELQDSLCCNYASGFLASMAYFTSTWLRDYLYIPLGSSRNGQRRMIFALMMTMLLEVYGMELHGISLCGGSFMASSSLSIDLEVRLDLLNHFSIHQAKLSPNFMAHYTVFGVLYMVDFPCRRCVHTPSFNEDVPWYRWTF